MEEEDKEEVKEKGDGVEEGETGRGERRGIRRRGGGGGGGGGGRRRDDNNKENRAKCTP